MAIKSLEQQTCEDCISRQAVLEIVERVLNKGDALFEIEKLPSVKPQDTKEIYNKGFADGQKALAEHLKLCKEELLDKIRAEIDEKKQKINFNGLGDYEKAQAEMRLSTLNELLQIIDKYKTESEAQE